MYFALYNPETGIIRLSIKGPSIEWAHAFMASEYPAYGIIEVDREVDGSSERVDVTVDPHVIVPFIPAKTPEQIKAEILAATQQRLDEFAESRGYDGILSAASYVTSTVEQFATEGQRAVNLRDQTWAALYAMLAEVIAGTRSMPAGYADIEAELPTLEWP